MNLATAALHELLWTAKRGSGLASGLSDRLARGSPLHSTGLERWHWRVDRFSRQETLFAVLSLGPHVAPKDFVAQPRREQPASEAVPE